MDRLSRRVHFVPSKSKDTAVDCAKNFFRDIFKNHGLPENIVSDRDSKFTSTFWKTLMDLCGIKLKMSTSRHPQTDRSSEIMNRMIENYLRCYCCYRQNDWDELLSYAEFAYNSAVSEELGMSHLKLILVGFPSHRSSCSLQSRAEYKVLKISRLSYKMFYTMLSFRTKLLAPDNLHIHLCDIEHTSMK
jgi:hypothetical protein